MTRFFESSEHQMSASLPAGLPSRRRLLSKPRIGVVTQDFAGAPDPAAWEKAVDALRAVVDRSRDDRGYKYDPPATTPPAASAGAGVR